MNVFYTALGNKTGVDQHPVRDNPLGYADGNVAETLRRGEARFRFDAGDPWFRVASKLGTLGSLEVDMVALGAGIRPDFYFVSKPKQ